jgi:hypothetical protein
MGSVHDVIRRHYPTIDQMPFCAALRDGRFGRADILRAEIVELYRALNTRGRIQDIYKTKLREEAEAQRITPENLEHMIDIIDDEGETEEHIDHLDMRFKLFVGTPVSRASKLRHHDELESINNEWMRVCAESDLFTLMAVTAAIEDWYAPLSAFFEDEYRKRGFSEDELELFIVHKDADVTHSTTQFDILEKNSAHIDLARMAAMIDRTFATSRGYDRVKLEFAEGRQSLAELLAA